MRITANGMMYSLDLLVSALVLWMIVLIVLAHAAQATGEARRETEQQALLARGMRIADSLVKNQDTNTGFGAAQYSPELHRVQANHLSSSLLQKISENPEILSAWLRTRETTVQLFKKAGGAKNCVAVERFVSIDGKKSVVGVRVCD